MFIRMLAFAIGAALSFALNTTACAEDLVQIYREALAKAGAVEELFDLFDEFLKNKGYLARGGQIIDATIVSAPKGGVTASEQRQLPLSASGQCAASPGALG